MKTPDLHSIKKTSDGLHFVSIFLKDKEGLYLLQKRDLLITDGSAGKLALFGGGIETGESIYHAIQRELFEELELSLFSCNIAYCGCYQSVSGKLFYIFEVSILKQERLILHEGMEIVRVTKTMLDAPENHNHFQKFYEIYLQSTPQIVHNL